MFRSWGIALGHEDRHLQRRGGSFICSYARLVECNNCIIMSGTSLRMFAFAPSLNNAQWGCTFGNPRNGLKAERTTVKLLMILWWPLTTANIYIYISFIWIIPLEVWFDSLSVSRHRINATISFILCVSTLDLGFDMITVLLTRCAVCWSGGRTRTWTLRRIRTLSRPKPFPKRSLSGRTSCDARDSPDFQGSCPWPQSRSDPGILFLLNIFNLANEKTGHH